MGGFSQVLRSPVVLLLLVVSLIVSGLTINLIQLALFLCVRPFSATVYRRLFYYTTYWIHGHFVFLAEWWGGLDVVCYTNADNWEKHLGKEHAVCILNHRYDIDWMVTFAVCDRIGMLGFCKAFAKKSIRNIPIVGWSLSMGGDVFLERDWEKDKAIIGRQVSELLDFPSAVWLMLAAEGTRFTPTKHEASQKFAREKGITGLQHHLIPRTKGFTHTVPHLKGKNCAIYDLQMHFKDGVEPTILGLMRGEKYVAYVYIDRFHTDDLPEGEAALSEWMHKLYQRKDRMADSFFKTGDFFRESGVPALAPRLLTRRVYSLLNLLFWAVVTLTPISYFVWHLLMAGSLLYISLVVFGIATCVGLVVTMVRMTQISKGSSYGSSVIETKSK